MHTWQSPSQMGSHSAQQLVEQVPFTGVAVHVRIEPGLQGPQIARADHTHEHPGQRTGLPKKQHALTFLQWQVSREICI
jgi:hypothetical protein